VFQSIEKALEPEVYRAHYPDWRVTQRETMEAVCADADAAVWVVVVRSTRIFSGGGIAKALTQHALAYFREAGMTTAMVETGGDLGHEPARRTYEAAGFQAFPSVRYFRMAS
jgi:GNAT superfamily N-acetyltransferase